MNCRNDLSRMTQSAGQWKRESLIFLLVFFGSTLPFLFAADYPFLQDWDDYTFIVKNPRLELSWQNFFFYLTNTFQDLHTPLPLWSFMVDKALWGLSPLPYRLENIFFHGAGACLLFRIFTFLGIRKSLAVSGAILWAVNPQKVESCIWITERKDVLCGFFAFASFLVFLYETKRGKYSFFSSLLMLLSFLAKPASLPLFGVMFLYLLCRKGKTYRIKNYIKMLLFPFLATLFFGLYSYFITRNGFPGGAESRFLVPFHNLFWYPVTAIIPFELSPMYPNIAEWSPHIPLFAGGAGALLLLFYLAKFLKLPFSKVFVFLLVTGGMMVPVLGLVHYTAMDYCDRYNYLVSAPVWGLLLFLMEKALLQYPAKKTLLYTLLSLAWFSYVWMCIDYGKFWRDSGKLFLYAAESPLLRPANETAIENGASSAIRGNDPQILERMAKRMEEDHQLYRPQNTHLLHTALFFRAHADMIRGNTPSAMEKYKLLAGLTQSGQLDCMRPDEFLKVLFRGGAVTSLKMGREEEGRIFFRAYFQVQKNRNTEYFFMLSRWGILEKNDKMRLYALEQLLRFLPGHKGFRKERDSLAEKIRRTP